MEIKFIDTVLLEMTNDVLTIAYCMRSLDVIPNQIVTVFQDKNYIYKKAENLN